MKIGNSRYCIILIGTDGSGKSTIGMTLEKRLEITSEYVYFGLKDFKLNWVEHLKKKNGDGTLLMRALILPIGYIFRRIKLKNVDAVILDRVPGWAFTVKTGWLFHLYKFLLPDADLLVLCSGNPEVISQRNTERKIIEIVNDIKKWEKVFDNYPAKERMLLDTTKQTIDESVMHINDHVNKMFNIR